VSAEVLIVGAGPSGLFAAHELARRGVRVRIVERDAVPHREARGTALQPGTLELLDLAGIVDPFLSTSVHVRNAGVYGPELELVVPVSFEAPDCDYPHQCQLPQWRTEEILTSHLAALGVEVERGVEVLSVEGGPDRVLARIRHAGGEEATVEAAYAIGAGGAHSITRRGMDEKLEGATYPGRFLVAEIAISSPLPPGQSGIVASNDGLLLIAPLPDGRFITFSDLDEDAPEPTPGEVADRVERRLAGRARPESVVWCRSFHMHRRIAPRLHDGRRFLVGDAGHLSSPFAGEGLNAGLHDAFDVGWKLALVLAGRAKPSLLESYELERAAADRHALEVSDVVHADVVSAVATIRAGQALPPGRDPDAAAQLLAARSMLDLSYAGSPLVAEWPGEGGTRPAPGERYAGRCALPGPGHHLLVFGDTDRDGVARIARRFDGLVAVADSNGLDAARAGVPAGGAVLVRPDGMIAFRAVPADGEGLAALEAHLAGYLDG
jgi:2-polyprenyl-6-methoxyphenol hydroxylase-like FAD-dependent oxidoreductase